MEHLRHFGLSRDPFANDPLVQLYFASAGHASAERKLLRGVSQAKGLCVLTGGEGTGKTMVVRHLLEALEEEVFEASLLVPVPGVSDGDWVLTRFARQLGVEEPSEDRSELLGQIYEALAIVREDGRHTVLIIDEAQVLVEKDALRGLRGLLNLEYEDRRLLTLVLVGLPSLEDAIAADPALAHRVDIKCRIPPMQDAAAVEYVNHRVRAVEGNPAILEAAAMQALIHHGAGAPRRLNTLADNALFEAYVAGRSAANAEDVRSAASELDFEAAPQPSEATAAHPGTDPTIHPAAQPSAHPSTGTATQAGTASPAPVAAAPVPLAQPMPVAATSVPVAQSVPVAAAPAPNVQSVPVAAATPEPILESDPVDVAHAELEAADPFEAEEVPVVSVAEMMPTNDFEAAQADAIEEPLDAEFAFGEPAAPTHNPDETIPFVSSPLEVDDPAGPQVSDALAAALDEFDVPEVPATEPVSAVSETRAANAAQLRGGAPRVGVPMHKGAPAVTRFVLEPEENLVGFDDFEDVVGSASPAPQPAPPAPAAAAPQVAAAPRVAAAPPQQPVAAARAAAPPPQAAPAPQAARPAPAVRPAQAAPPAARPVAQPVAQPAPRAAQVPQAPPAAVARPAAPAPVAAAAPVQGPPKEDDELEDVFVDLI